MMKRSDLLEALAEAEANSKQHYAETLKWCEETGFPAHLIGNPDVDVTPAPPRSPLAPRRRAYPADGRFHRKWCGYKKLHES
jgi:hypothetical protein